MRSRASTKLPAYLPSLDGLRGIAILLVVLVHMRGKLEPQNGAFGLAVRYALTQGWTGVQLFFVLSGFLITGILLDTQSAGNYLSSFFARRLLRIFPLYYLTLFLAFVVLPAITLLPPTLAHDRAHQAWFWFYLTNWTVPYAAGPLAFPQFWSLAVEEQFYLVWPFLLRHRSPASCLRLCLGVAAASLAIRVVMLAVYSPEYAIYSFSVTRMDALALGGAAAAALRIPSLCSRLFARRQRIWWASFAVGIGGALVTGRYSLGTLAGQSVGYTFLAVAMALAVLAAAIADATPGARVALLRSRPLRTFGKYSYGIYVLHKSLHDFVGMPLMARLGLDVTRSVWGTLAYEACGATASLAVAFASYHLFERHFLRLKDRFVPQPAALADYRPVVIGSPE
jgi:peptidoglycan/LPS O-acetylase OafA/YrhL